MNEWTEQRVEQVASDPRALQAAQGAARPARWRALGRAEQLAWGEFRGSASRPYQVRVDLSDGSCGCDCPSRKQPCKHGLGLLLLHARGALPLAAAPAFAEEWAEQRARRAQGRAERAADGGKPDLQAKARRGQRREQRVAAGIEQLEAWTSDLVRQGLATARSQPSAFWAQMAARLVDAQAPGLARRVRALELAAVSGGDWQSRLLAGLARLQLLIDAYRNLAALPEALASEVRSQIGWTQDRDALRERAGVRDTWHVLGVRVYEDESLSSQRIWLRGEQSGRFALLLEFAAGEQPFASDLQIDQRVDAELVYYDAVPPLRAAERQRFVPEGAEQSRRHSPPPVAESEPRSAASSVERAWSCRPVDAAAGPALGGLIGDGPAARAEHAVSMPAVCDAVARSSQPLEGAGDAAPLRPEPRSGGATRLPAGSGIARMQADHATRLAESPWLTRWPVLLGPVRAVLRGERLLLEDAERRCVPVRPGFRQVWPLIALAGADTLQFFGEWDGEVFEPVTVERSGELYTPGELGELSVLTRVP
jgi:hypothetical protein